MRAPNLSGIVLGIAMLLPLVVVAQTPPPTTLAELLERVKSANVREDELMAERERRFLDRRDDQAKLLADATTARRAAEVRADRLKAEFETGEERLAELETALDENSGDLRELFTVVKQIAGDALVVVQNSLVSAEFGPRGELLETLSVGESTPSATELRAMWVLMLEEMSENGRVKRFTAPVISGRGEEEMREVTRIGAFAAVSDGRYLRYLTEAGRLLALTRQPGGISASDVRAFETAEAELMPIAVDPSRGSILSLIVQTPDLRDRIEQGGIIGYLIIVLGLIGGVLGVERLVAIALAERGVARQRKSPTPVRDNYLGMLRIQALEVGLDDDADSLATKLDEVVAASSRKLFRGLATLAIFAAVSPLLGLLGTVTGMIETFQVITLFGAGDPRLMSGGISEALITTQLGLSVAIPLLLVHSFVQGRANKVVALLDEESAELFVSAGRQRSSGRVPA